MAAFAYSVACRYPILGWIGKNGKFTLKPEEAWHDRHASVPCGQCAGCRLERARQWAVRIMHESSLHNVSSFLTLTYNDDSLNSNIMQTIIKKDIQLFIKRLRKHLTKKDRYAKIRYYVCGEYGEQATLRPHYHAIIFGYFPEDSRLYKSRREGNLYISPVLNRIWGKGYVTIGNVTFESASYVARYVMKKVTGPLSEKHYNGREPEFSLMSLRPGIGAGWFMKYKDEVVRDDSVISRGMEMKPPRYYVRKIQESDPTLAKEIHFRRLGESPLSERQDARRLVRCAVQEARIALFARDQI